MARTAYLRSLQPSITAPTIQKTEAQRDPAGTQARINASNLQRLQQRAGEITTRVTPEARAFLNGGGSSVIINPLTQGGGLPTGNIGGSLPTIGGIDLSGLAQAGVNALIGRLAGGSPAPAPSMTSMLQPAAAPQSTAVATTGGRCGCTPRPGPCQPQYIETDFSFGGLGNPCSANPLYPRLTTVNGVSMCAPARKRPRMNPLNPRAAGRAARRLAAFGRATKTIKKAVSKAERALR